MTRTLRVIDIDGVIFDFVGHFYEYWGIVPDSYPEHWDAMAEVWKAGRDSSLLFQGAVTQMLASTTSPSPGLPAPSPFVVNEIPSWVEDGDEVVFLTNRNQHTSGPTMELVRNITGVEFPTVHHTKNKRSALSMMLKEQEFDRVFVYEDSPGNLERYSILATKYSGMWVMKVAHLYNTEAPYDFILNGLYHQAGVHNVELERWRMHLAKAASRKAEPDALQNKAVALRDNNAKPPVHLLGHFRQGLEALAHHAYQGQQKYPNKGDKPNWMLGGKPDAEYLGAAMRHLLKMQGGEWYDEELGTSHAAAVMWNMAALTVCNHPDDPHVQDGWEMPSSWPVGG